MWESNANIFINCFLLEYYFLQIFWTFISQRIFSFLIFINSFQQTIEFIKISKQNSRALFIYFDAMRKLVTLLSLPLNIVRKISYLGWWIFYFQQILILNCSCKSRIFFILIPPHTLLIQSWYSSFDNANRLKLMKNLLKRSWWK